MSSDDLSAPLGQTAPRKRRFRLPVSAPQAIAGVLGAVLLGFLGFAIFGNNPMGGEPVARVALKPPAPVEEKPPIEIKRGPAKSPDKVAEKTPDVAGQKTITIIDGSSGARRDVVVSSDGSENPA